MTVKPPVLTHIRARHIRNNVIRRASEQLRNHTELVDVILPGEDGPPENHLGEDAARTPDIHFLGVSSPGEHDFGGSVVPGGDVAGHLRILHAGEPEIADF